MPVYKKANHFFGSWNVVKDLADRVSQDFLGGENGPGPGIETNW